MADVFVPEGGTQAAWESLQQAKQQTAQLGQEAYKKYASPALFGVMAKQQMMSKGPSTELRKEESRIQKELETAPYEFEEIESPLIRGKAAAQKMAGLRQQARDVKSLRLEEEGTIMDWIQGASAAIQAGNERRQMELDHSKYGFQQALEMYGIASGAEAEKRAEEWKQKEFDESKRQFEAQMAFSEKELATQVALARSSSGRSGASATENKAAQRQAATADIQNWMEGGYWREEKAIEKDLIPAIRYQYPDIAISEIEKLVWNAYKPYEKQAEFGFTGLGKATTQAAMAGYDFGGQ